MDPGDNGWESRPVGSVSGLEPTDTKFMSEPKRDDEPTMEEILASIRKIISEDDPATTQAADADETAAEIDAAAADEAEGPEAAAPQDADGDDAEPMELTQLVSEDGSVVDLRAEEAPAANEPAANEGTAEPEAEAPPAMLDPLVPEGAPAHWDRGDRADRADRASEDLPAADGASGEPEAAEPEHEPLAEAARDEASEGSQDLETEALVSSEATAAASAAMSRLKDRLVAGQTAVGGGDKSLEALARETMAPHLKSWLDRNLPELVERIVREEIEKLVQQSEGH